jgi:hypothetical protein
LISAIAAGSLAHPVQETFGMTEKIAPNITHKHQPSSEEKFVPRTDLAKTLWALRQKYIAEGGRLYTLREIQHEIARRRGEVES